MPADCPDEKRDNLIVVCGVVSANYDRFIGRRHSSPYECRQFIVRPG
jgi:hypothetical protein